MTKSSQLADDHEIVTEEILRNYMRLNTPETYKPHKLHMESLCDTSDKKYVTLYGNLKFWVEMGRKIAKVSHIGSFFSGKHGCKNFGFLIQTFVKR